MENKNMIENELENVAGGAAYSSNFYTIKKGDTLGILAARFGTTVNNLMALNPHITNANLIYAGDTIRIR
jgi:LysM repeat protein